MRSFLLLFSFVLILGCGRPPTIESFFDDEQAVLKSVRFSSRVLTHEVQNQADLEFLQASLLEEGSAGASGKTISYPVRFQVGRKSYPLQAYVHRESYRIDFDYEYKLGLYDSVRVDFSDSPAWMETIRILRDR